MPGHDYSSIQSHCAPDMRNHLQIRQLKWKEFRRNPGSRMDFGHGEKQVQRRFESKSSKLAPLLPDTVVCCHPHSLECWKVLKFGVCANSSCQQSVSDSVYHSVIFCARCDCLKGFSSRGWSWNATRSEQKGRIKGEQKAKGSIVHHSGVETILG